MKQRVQTFLSDLYFDLSLFAIVLIPIFSALYLVRDKMLDLNLWTGIHLAKILGIMVYGQSATLHAWTAVPADFTTMCAWPAFIWLMSAMVLRLYLSLGWSWRVLCWGMLLLKFAAIGAMGWLYAPAGHDMVALFAMGIFPMTITVMSAILLECAPNKRKWAFEVIAGVMMANHFVAPWFWLLFV